jgi:dTDP-glucose pyrophosphorylase
MYTIEILIATMFKKNNEEIISLLEDMNISSDAVVINQCKEDKLCQIKYKNHNITVVYSTERGLSKSRNLALKHATADIVVIADDDVCYLDNYSSTIIAAYEAHPMADILTFKVKDYKSYFPAERKLNSLLIHKVASWEITMIVIP